MRFRRARHLECGSSLPSPPPLQGFSVSRRSSCQGRIREDPRERDTPHEFLSSTSISPACSVISLSRSSKIYLYPSARFRHRTYICSGLLNLRGDLDSQSRTFFPRADDDAPSYLLPRGIDGKAGEDDLVFLGYLANIASSCCFFFFGSFLLSLSFFLEPQGRRADSEQTAGPWDGVPVYRRRILFLGVLHARSGLCLAARFLLSAFRFPLSPISSKLLAAVFCPFEPA